MDTPGAGPMRLRLAAGLAAAGLLAVACGSTVPEAARGGGSSVALDSTGAPQEVADGPGFDELGQDLGGGEEMVLPSAPEAGGDGGGGTVTVGSGSSGPSADASSSAADPSAEQPRQTPAASADQEQVRMGRGVTDRKIFIGVVRVRNAGQANQAIGADVSTGDPNLQQNAMIEAINRSGGLAGRELVPVEHEVDENTAETQAQIEQAMCATWTQDNEVFAAVSSLASDVLRTCMHQAGSVLIGPSLSTSDSVTFEQFPHFYETAAMRLDRIARVFPKAMAADGYFDDGAVVGVVTYDTPEFARATDGVLLPELARLGFSNVEVARVPLALTVAEVGSSSAGISNAVLRFRTRGVTHVMFFEAGAILAFLWFPQAESQGYRPRYGLTSQSGPVTHDEPQQLRNALAIGWIPFIDVGDNADTQLPPGFPECLRIMQDAGAEYSSDNPNAKRASGSTCDAFRLLQAGLAAAGSDLTPAGFARGVQRIGGDFRTAHGYGVDLRSRRDGASVVRPTAYRDDCRCWRYSGPARPAD